MRSLLAAAVFCMSSWALADANRDLIALFDKEWQYTLKTNPVMASMEGDLRYNRQWQDLSLEGMAKQAQHDQKVVQQLLAIESQSLSGANRINRALYLRQRNEALEYYQLGLHTLPITMRGGIQTLYDLASLVPLRTPQQFEDWLFRMETIPVVIEQTEQLMRRGMKHGLTQPKIIMQRVVKQLRTLTVEDPEKNPFFKPFAQIPESIPEAQRKQLQSKARNVITNFVRPAYQKFAVFFEKTYLPACRDTPGIGSVPNGKNIYRYVARHFTTTELTPEQIHETGLREVARIRKEMQMILEETKFDGNLDQFMTWLRTDPQFFYQTSEELYKGYLAVSKRLDPELTKLFGKLPRIPYRVKPIPDEIAPDTTTAYYQPSAADGSRPGYYYVNLYKPESRPKWEMEVLSVHEAVPGHHLQISLALEMKNVPEFRKHARFTAYVEGWGLYSERLGYQMGLYKDPYSHFGQLTYDMWRAVRLVVDTGIHYFGWSRQKAIEYFMANAPKSKQDIVNEIDRYIGWPGQALAYKIGQLRILELRAKAESQLKEKFNIRDFHDVLLSTGAVPLDVMEANIDDWLVGK